MAITGKAESVSGYSETRIDVRVKKAFTSDPDVDWASDQAMQHRLRPRCTLSEIPAL
jgi:hypothetical protein